MVFLSTFNQNQDYWKSDCWLTQHWRQTLFKKMDVAITNLNQNFERCNAELKATRAELEASFAKNVCFPAQQEQSQPLPAELHPLSLLARIREIEQGLPELHKQCSEIVEGTFYLKLLILTNLLANSTTRLVGNRKFCITKKSCLHSILIWKESSRFARSFNVWKRYESTRRKPFCSTSAVRAVFSSIPSILSKFLIYCIFIKFTANSN